MTPKWANEWERRNGLFTPVTDFDGDTFDNPHPEERVRTTADDLSELFENGYKQLALPDSGSVLISGEENKGESK
jgi:hypothetical protein